MVHELILTKSIYIRTPLYSVHRSSHFLVEMSRGILFTQGTIRTPKQLVIRMTAENNTSGNSTTWLRMMVSSLLFQASSSVSCLTALSRCATCCNRFANHVMRSSIKFTHRLVSSFKVIFIFSLCFHCDIGYCCINTTQISLMP